MAKTKRRRAARAADAMVTTKLSADTHARVVAYQESHTSEFGTPSLRATVEALVIAGLAANGAK